MFLKIFSPVALLILMCLKVYCRRVCESSTDCTGSQICDGGHCFYQVPECSTGSDCVWWETCRGAYFTKRSDPCNANATCYGGQHFCLSSCDGQSQCPSGFYCLKDYCRAYNEIECEDGSNCPHGSTCAFGFCRESCSSDSDCPGIDYCNPAGNCFNPCYWVLLVLLVVLLCYCYWRYWWDYCSRCDE